MIHFKPSLEQQISELLQLQNKLQIISNDDKQITLAGSILVNRESKGFKLCKGYKVTIIIPLNTDEIPYVMDIGNHIENNYSHRYSDGKLCLETDTSIKVRFVEGFSIVEWLSDYVEPYYFTYEFHKRFGEFPFGERSHDWLGILETYSELFQEEDLIKVIKIIKGISINRYCGYAPCYCGSSKELRWCHGPNIRRFYRDSRLKTIVHKDYQYILKVMNEYSGQQNNSKKTK